MKLNKIYAGILILGIACITSCEKDNDHTPSPSPSSNEVAMSGDKFVPATITVTVGTTVKWINKDAHIHTVTSDNAVFSSGDIGLDQVFSFKFTARGEYTYHCI